jgi:PadR family transcriptional regulator, regulatory protein PadR
MSEKPDVWQDTLELMALKAPEAPGPLHGYGIARRIEQTGENRPAYYKLMRARRNWPA